MDRRDFIAVGVGGTMPTGLQPRGTTTMQNRESELRPGESVRRLFPRLEHEVFLNAARGTPLGTFGAAGLNRIEELWRQGWDWEVVRDTLSRTREAFARLIGARPSEIGLVHCTKAGEQIVLDGLPALRSGGNVVSNDLHFAGSLHNLVGLERSGVDVRIVRGDGRDVSLKAMTAAIDRKTALVAVTLVSNVNGRIEALPELSAVAHDHGAYVYADIIQAAGVVPLDVRKLDIDFAACSGYKWLYGPHGCGFFYVRKELQGEALQDRLFPGSARHNYAPWVEEPDPAHGEFVYHAPHDAHRYQPGHTSYLGYGALQEGLAFIERLGVEAIRSHGVSLCKRLLDQVDRKRFSCLSPDVEEVPIISFALEGSEDLARRLRAQKIDVTITPRFLRVSPGPYNIPSDIDRLARILNA